MNLAKGFPHLSRIIEHTRRATLLVLDDEDEVGTGGTPVLLGRHRLDPDELGELLAEGEAGVANLTDEIRAIGHEPDDLILAQADLAQAFLHRRLGA